MHRVNACRYDGEAPADKAIEIQFSVKGIKKNNQHKDPLEISFLFTFL